MDQILQLADVGLTACLLAAVVALWKDRQKDSQSKDTMIRFLLDLNLLAGRGEKQRAKIGKALGVNLDDTEGKRPPGLDDELRDRGLL